MALVAVAMVAILAMAALSIDAVALYLAREEAQRAADSAALAGARILSMSGMTGDPNNATSSWSLACDAASSVATAVAQQNKIAGLSLPAAQITVTFPNNTGCGSNPIFGVNPQVTVKVSRQNLPTFFARVWSRSTHTVVASATAEAYNPSNSGNFTSGLTVTPVQPRCVKPWIVPNLDTNGTPFVNLATGDIGNKGINQLNGTGTVGKELTLTSDCTGSPGCMPLSANPPGNNGGGVLQYVPALVVGTPKAVSSCATADTYQEAIGGCDQAVYACGVVSGGTQADFTINPGGLSGDTATATQCLIHGATGGQDTINVGSGTTTVFPFQVDAGFQNPLVQSGIAFTSDPITSSSSIVTVPIYDSSVAFSTTVSQPAVTIVGFLQVFIERITVSGDPVVRILNVAGCGNAAAAAAVTGTSPVPIRLITAP